MAANVATPLPVRFSSAIHLTLHQAFLATAGVLLSDPIARVHVVTVKTTRTAPPSSTVVGGAPDDGVRIVLNSREVGKTKPCFFTAHPEFNESFDFTVAETSALTTLAAPSTTNSSSSNNSVAGGGAAHGKKKRSDAGESEVKHNQTSSDNSSVVDYVVITLESADGTAFYGEAYAPFSPHCTSVVPSTSPVRVMLAPRNAQDVADPLFLQDNALLEAKHLDDFGFVSISWEVAVVPHGGALLGGSGDPAAAATPGPVGLALRATWLTRAAAYTRGAQYTTSVEFGGSDRFVFTSATQPLCLTLQGGGAPEETTLRRAVFHCAVQSVVEPGESHDVAVPLPLPSLSASAARDRDVHWAAPVRTAHGRDLGLLLVSMRVSSRPLSADAPRCGVDACPRINDPLHQEEHQHVAQLWGMAEAPHTPPGAYQPIAWESPQHVAEAQQRRWRLQCVREAQPTLDHVRHLFDVLMGRTTLDSGVAHVAAAFFNKSPAEVSAGDLREVMVAFAFHASRLTVQEAARFCFVALRRDVHDAVAAEEVQYIVDHCLVGGTVEMPAGERRRWVADLFPSVSVVSYADFTKYFIHNYAMWAAFGVTLTVSEADSGTQHCHAAFRQQQQQLRQQWGGAALVATGVLSGAGGVVEDVGRTPATAAAAAPAAGSRSVGISPAPDSIAAAAAAAASPASVWRSFVVRTAANPSKAFSVTAHVADHLRDVMAMVEDNAGIAVARQEWRQASGTTSSGAATAAGATVTTPPPAASMKVMDPLVLVGNTTLGLPSALRGGASAAGTQEVWIYEAEETVLLRLHVKDRLHSKKDWQERVPVKDKVLKLRAAVQRRTLIPLSRCTLTVRREDGTTTVLQDRHTIAHYRLVSGDVVEVSHD